MTAMKTMAAGILVWGTLGTLAHGAPMSWYGGSSPWPSWYANQVQSNSQLASSARRETTNLGDNGNTVWWLNSPVSAPVREWLLQRLPAPPLPRRRSMPTSTSVAGHILKRTA